VLKKRKVEAHGDFILDPVSPKEYKDTVAELNGSRTNWVFEFFKINPPERVRFAKHREAAERKAAALAAAEADTNETATSPRAAPKKTGRMGAPRCGHCHRRREGSEETRRAAGGLSPITQEDPTHRRRDRPR
jgi:mono/diheme cytochrome c family protein